MVTSPRFLLNRKKEYRNTTACRSYTSNNYMHVLIIVLKQEMLNVHNHRSFIIHTVYIQHYMNKHGIVMSNMKYFLFIFIKMRS